MKIVASIAVGTLLAIAAQLATREAQSGWAVAVGSDSFVVLNERGAPSEVCTVEVGETHCHPVRRMRDVKRQAIQRWRHHAEAPGDVADPPRAL